MRTGAPWCRPTRCFAPGALGVVAPPFDGGGWRQSMATGGGYGSRVSHHFGVGTAPRALQEQAMAACACTTRAPGSSLCSAAHQRNLGWRGSTDNWLVRQLWLRGGRPWRFPAAPAPAAPPGRIPAACSRLTLRPRTLPAQSRVQLKGLPANYFSVWLNVVLTALSCEPSATGHVTGGSCFVFVYCDRFVHSG